MPTTKRVSYIHRYADVGVLEIPMGVNVIINDGPKKFEPCLTVDDHAGRALEWFLA